MGLAKLKFDQQGRLRAYYQDERETAQHDGEFAAAHAIEFDPATNPHIASAVHSDWGNWSFDGTRLLRRGQAVAVNPPGERATLEASRETLLAALRERGWDGLTPQQRTDIALLLVGAEPRATLVSAGSGGSR